MKQITEVNHVKNSSFLEVGSNHFVCLHYNTEILEVKDGKILKLYVPSVTSSKMVKRCLEYVFGC